MRIRHGAAREADGRFGNQAFVHVAEKNEYRCPAGDSLSYRYTSLEAGLLTHAYWSVDAGDELT